MSRNRGIGRWRLRRQGEPSPPAVEAMLEAYAVGGRSAAMGRRTAAVGVVRRGILGAEEKYLVEPGASLGTWFARVQEPICVGCRVTLLRLGEGRRLGEADIAGEQLGLQADICAEAIRAAARLSPSGPSPGATDDILASIALLGDRRSVATLFDVLVALAFCTSALEPLANALREGDLPMGHPTDGEAVTDCLIEVSVYAFGVIHALC